MAEPDAPIDIPCLCGSRGLVAATLEGPYYDVLCTNLTCLAKTPLFKSAKEAFEFWDRIMAPQR